MYYGNNYNNQLNGYNGGSVCWGKPIVDVACDNSQSQYVPGTASVASVYPAQNGGGRSGGFGNSIFRGNARTIWNSKTNLIVNYLPQDMSDQEFSALFEAIGPIHMCRIMRNPQSGISFGYGFVDFMAENDAQRAIQYINGLGIRNKRLKVAYARPRGESMKETNLYVAHLPNTITEYQLVEIFGKYGSIVQKHILRDKGTGMPRGVAFVRYNKHEEALNAIAALNNVVMTGGGQPLNVRLAAERK